jgi:hypothetical protein
LAAVALAKAGGNAIAGFDKSPGYSDALGTVAAAAPQRVRPAAAGRRDDPLVGRAVLCPPHEIHKSRRADGRAGSPLPADTARAARTGVRALP